MRIAGTPGPMAKILLSHPEARERAAAIETIARNANLRSGGTCDGLLTAAEWAALKKICQAAPKTAAPANPQASRTTPQGPNAAARERPGGERRGALPLPESSGR
jgi:hypothetical protein